MRLNGEVFCVDRARAVPTYRELTSTNGRLVHEVVNDAVLKGLVGAPGFEPGTSCAQGKRATRLRHAPKERGIRG